jgi:hypothetical protein
MNDTNFLFDESYLQEGKRSFLEQCELRCMIFSEIQYQTIVNNANSLFVVFQYLNANIFRIQGCFKKENVFNFSLETKQQGWN